MTNASINVRPSASSVGISLGPVRLVILTFLGLSIASSLWGLAKWTHDSGLDDLRLQLDARMNLYSSNIVSELEKYEYLPPLLARDPILHNLFSEFSDAQTIDSANRHLAAIRQTAEVSAVYVMAPSGTTLAASNWDKDTSFVGKNFRFRPYFQRAMIGEIGHYFAMGTTSRIPGYYLSYPIEDDDGINGVVVVKVSVARLEESWSNAQENVVITDDNGVIIIASEDAWKFRTFQALDKHLKDLLIASRQYGDAPLEELHWAKKTDIDPNTAHMSLRFPLSGPQTSTDRAQWENVYVRSRPVLGTDWTIHYIFKEAKLREDVIISLVIGAFGWLVIILSFLYMVQRRKIINSRLEFQARHQKTLEEAAIQLEDRVERRTKALREANTRLEEEISERKKAEEDLHLAQDELIQAGKLAALGQMAAGITHEMNQPLTAIRSYADNAAILLERDRQSDARSNLAQITGLCERLAKISGQLKVFSRKTPSEKGPISLAVVIGDTINLLANSAKLDTVKINNTVRDNSLVVLGEAIRLEQVLLNILRNALDAMQDQADAEVWISTRLHHRRVLLEIRDNGPGFKEDELSRIFDPFFTTKDVGKGLGLGLSISSRIVQDFGGVLKAANHPDGGAVFTIELLQQAKTHG